MLTNPKTTQLQHIIREDDLLSLVEGLVGQRKVIGPVARGDRFFYQEISRASDLDLSFNYCTYSVRSVLFPAVETLFTFDHDHGRFTPNAVMDDRPTALIGVHPCDLHAIRLLDRVFETDHRDEHYLARRHSTFIVGVDCVRPCATDAFCHDMHTDSADEGFDVMLYPLSTQNTANRRYGVVVGSDAGRQWIESGHAVRPTEDDQRMFVHYLRHKSAAFTKQLESDCEELPAMLRRSYDSLLWEGTAQRCYSCGSCNLVCPTCYCFNITDDLSLNGDTGARTREWDSCMLHDFASVAGGHNFRAKTSQRLRHRVFRKAAWIHERSGLAGCVGCGRCDRACTAKISMVEMLNQLAEEDTDDR
ncbi:MAG: 4Fe-4S dicluster domain-containing protein [Planctomycetota bacterium]